MRQTWERAGVPVPEWRPVDSVDDLYQAWDRLVPPLLLKAGWSAAAVGQVLVRSRQDIPTAWDYTRSAIGRGAEAGFGELHADGAADFLVDEIIASTTRSWFRDQRYGDHLSVEGLVVDGTYRPVCITAKAPTTAPFTERANFTPCVLDEELQRLVEVTARRAVDALGLETCGTHTEIKLMADHGMCLLESAARFGGVLLVREVEAVYGVDMVGALTVAALGERPSLPPEMLTRSTDRAAGSVALYAIDARGEPWSSAPVFEPGRVDWSALVSADTRVEIFPDLTMPPGGPMPPYDPPNGYLNSAGVLFLTARGPEELLCDAYSIMNGLEAAMTRCSDGDGN
jgi:biotin carboxylase